MFDYHRDSSRDIALRKMNPCANVSCQWQGTCTRRGETAVCEAARWLVPVLTIMGLASFFALVVGCYFYCRMRRIRRGWAVVPTLTHQRTQSSRPSQTQIVRQSQLKRSRDTPPNEEDQLLGPSGYHGNTIYGASDDDPDYIDLSEVEPGPQISNRTGVDQQGTESAYVDVNRKNTERRNYTQLLPQESYDKSGYLQPIHRSRSPAVRHKILPLQSCQCHEPQIHEDYVEFLRAKVALMQNEKWRNGAFLIRDPITPQENVCKVIVQYAPTQDDPPKCFWKCQVFYKPELGKFSLNYDEFDPSFEELEELIEWYKLNNGYPLPTRLGRRFYCYLVPGCPSCAKGSLRVRRKRPTEEDMHSHASGEPLS